MQQISQFNGDGRQGIGMIAKAALAAATLSMLGVGWWLLGDRENQQEYPINRVISYSFEIINKTNLAIEHADFWAYAPVKQTSYQRLDSLQVSEPYELTEDEIGNQVIHVQFKDFPPYGTRILTVQASLQMSDTPVPLSLSNRQFYLQGEKYIEADSKPVRHAAEALKVSDPMATGRAVFDWVRGHVKDAGYVSEPRGALYALQNRQGDCTEYASLYAALARADGIPARVMGGYVYDRNTVASGSDYHNWAEFYADGAWHVADAQKDVFLANPSNFIAMNIVSDALNNPMQKNMRFRLAEPRLSAKLR